MKWVSAIKKKTNLNLEYFISNSIWVGSRELVVAILGLITVAIIARVVPKEVYGQYQLILSLIATVSLFSLPGLNTAIIQSTAKGYDGSYKKAVRTSFKWSMLASLLLVSVGLFWLTNDNALGIPALLSGLFFPFLYAPNTWEPFLQGKAKFKVIAKYTIFKNIFYSSFFILTILLFPKNLILITLAFLLTNAAINLALYKKSLVYIKNKKVDKETISYGFFITKISILNILSSHLDKIIIAIFIGPIELAVYAMGVNLIKKITTLLKSFLSITTPIVSRKDTLKRRNYLLLFLISLLISILLYILIPYLVEILLSKKYSSAIPIARIITVFIPFFVISSLYKNHFMLFVKNKKILFLESFISPLIKILLISALSFFFGIQGLAMAYGLQYIVPIIVLFVLSRSIIKQPSS